MAEPALPGRRCARFACAPPLRLAPPPGPFLPPSPSARRASDLRCAFACRRRLRGLVAHWRRRAFLPALRGPAFADAAARASRCAAQVRCLAWSTWPYRSSFGASCRFSRLAVKALARWMKAMARRRRRGRRGSRGQARSGRGVDGDRRERGRGTRGGCEQASRGRGAVGDRRERGRDARGGWGRWGTRARLARGSWGQAGNAGAARAGGQARTRDSWKQVGTQVRLVWEGAGQKTAFSPASRGLLAMPARSPLLFRQVRGLCFLSGSFSSFSMSVRTPFSDHLSVRSPISDHLLGQSPPISPIWVRARAGGRSKKGGENVRGRGRTDVCARGARSMERGTWKGVRRGE